MTRHIIDRARPSTMDRLRRYLSFERQAFAHPATQRLRLRSPATPDAGRRLREFLRIARGRSV